MQDTSRNTPNREVAGEADPARREVLATIGRFAYVAPALALLAQPKFAHAGYGRGGGDEGGSFGGDGGSFGGGDGGSSGGGSGGSSGGVSNVGGGNGGSQRHKRRRNGGSSWKFW